MEDVFRQAAMGIEPVLGIGSEALDTFAVVTSDEGGLVLDEVALAGSDRGGAKLVGGVVARVEMRDEHSRLIGDGDSRPRVGQSAEAGLEMPAAGSARPRGRRCRPAALRRTGSRAARHPLLLEVGLRRGEVATADCGPHAHHRVSLIPRILARIGAEPSGGRLRAEPQTVVRLVDAKQRLGTARQCPGASREAAIGAATNLQEQARRFGRRGFPRVSHSPQSRIAVECAEHLPPSERQAPFQV